MAERSKLSALLTGVMSAVQKAATTAGQQNLYMLDHYFDEVDGAYVPRRVSIEVAPGQYLNVPLISLIEPGGYKLGSLEMELSVKLSLDQVKKATHACLDHQVNKGSYQVELCPKSQGGQRASDVVNLKVTFTGDEPSEGLMKIIEDLNNTITPRPKPAVDLTDPTAETELDNPVVDEDTDDDAQP